MMNEEQFATKFEDYHWIARNLGEMYERIMSYPVLTYDALLEMRRFMAQIKIQVGKPDSEVENWTDPGMEIEIENWIDIDPKTGEQKKGRPLMARTPEEINRILSDPGYSGNLKAKFSYAFWRKAETYPQMIQAELAAFKKVEREPFEDFSDLFFTKWVTGGNSGFVTSTSGQNGSAKTGWLLVVGEMAMRRDENIRMPTNIVIRTDSDQIKKRIQPFSTIGEWVRLLLLNKIEGNRSYSAIDELTNSNIRRKATMHSTTLSFDRMDKNTRKLGDDNDYAWHFRSEVPKEVEEKSVFKVVKHGSTLVPQQRHLAEIDYDYGHGLKRKYISGVPRPGLEYVSDAWAFFVLDVDIDQIWLDFAKVQRAEDDEKEATYKRLEIVEAAIEENQSSELEEDVFLPIKEAAERAKMSVTEIKNSQYFVLSDRKKAGWYAKPANGYNWNLEAVEEDEINA